MKNITMTSLPLCMLLLVAGLSYVAPAQQYVIEVDFVADSALVKKFQSWGYSGSAANNQIKKELNNHVEEVNKFYKPLNIEMRIKGLNFPSNKLFSRSELRGKLLPKVTAMEKVRAYLKSQNINGFDVAVLLTGYDIVGDGNNSLASGAAYGDSICQDNAFAVIEVEGSHRLAISLAHEVAHTMGAYHDGEENTCQDGYIMSIGASTEDANRWSFSSCSRDYITKFIAALDKSKNNCLLKSSTSPFRATKKEKDLLNPDKICQRRGGSGSKVVMSKNPESYNVYYLKGDIVCKELWCYDPKEGVYDAFPSEGMICDVGKRCSQGKCKKAPSNFPTPNNIDPDCVFGDSKANKIGRVRGTCANIVKKKSGKMRCRGYVFRTQCCESCKPYYH